MYFLIYIFFFRELNIASWVTCKKIKTIVIINDMTVFYHIWDCALHLVCTKLYDHESKNIQTTFFSESRKNCKMRFKYVNILVEFLTGKELFTHERKVELLLLLLLLLLFYIL